MGTRQEKYANVQNQTPTVGLDYEKEYHRLSAQINEMRVQHQEELFRNDEEWMKKMAAQDEKRVDEIRALKKELNYNKNIIKSVLHIRED